MHRCIIFSSIMHFAIVINLQPTLGVLNTPEQLRVQFQRKKFFQINYYWIFLFFYFLFGNITWKTIYKWYLPKTMQIFLRMHHFYLPIKLSVLYLKINIVLVTLLIKPILSSNLTFLENIPTNFFSKYQKLQFLWFIQGKKVFYVIFTSVFFSMLK